MLLLFIMNVLGFMIVGFDKWKAKCHGWRVPELNLFLIAFFGGALGVYAGMQIFRHKTKHYSFTVGIPLLLAMNVIIIYFLR